MTYLEFSFSCELFFLTIVADAHNYTLNYSTKSTSKFASSNNLADTAKFTLCLLLRTTAAAPMTLVSYTSAANNRELRLSYKGSGITEMELNGVTRLVEFVLLSLLLLLLLFKLHFGLMEQLYDR